MGARGSEELGEELSSLPLLLEGLMEDTVVVAVVLGEAGGVKPENLLAIKLGNLKSAGLRREGVGKARGRACCGEK